VTYCRRVGSARTYAPGTPSWVDLEAPDLDRASAFYRDLFGWETDGDSPDYRMFRLGDADVAGLSPLTGPGPRWVAYVTVADLDAAAGLAADRGGAVLAGPMVITTAGRLAVVADDQGATLALWQPGDHLGADVVDEPGALCWIELACRDDEAAKAFYGAVLGWSGETHPFGGTSGYIEFTPAGGTRPVAGMVRMNEQWPDDVPPHWMVCFAVADPGAAAARVAELGGAVSVPPFDLPHVGRLAVVQDPDGAVFTVMARAG
jgi:uncharacterized protein